MTAKLDKFHLKDIDNEQHPSIFSIHDEYDILIMRLPYKLEEHYEYVSHAFVFTEDSYYYYDKVEKKFDDLKSIRGVYNLLNKKIDSTMQMTNEIYDSIEEIEDGFYESEYIKEFNHIWFSYKNSLIKINRVLLKTIEQLKRFIQNYKREDDFLEINFSDLLEHLERTHRTASHALEKLDALYNFYSSNNNEKMNRTIYVLTLLSGIFLPLNLIVGFFGMNTSTLPFTQEEGGTYSVIILLAAMGIISYLLLLLLRRNRI